MKKFVAFCLMLILTASASALEDKQVMFVGGTTQTVKPGVVGHLDTTSDTALTFEHPGGKLQIPYSDIQSFQYSTEVTHHLGVLPAIAISLLAKRPRHHYFRISYRDENKLPQVVILEVPTAMTRVVQAVLEARAAHPCNPYFRCGSARKDLSLPAPSTVVTPQKLPQPDDSTGTPVR